MQRIDTNDLNRILEAWDELLREFPAMKRELLEDLGEELLSGVRSEIRGTGTVQSWQERYLGSKNGYVAVRPKADTYKVTAHGKRYAVGYVTNAIENGHRHRSPSQQPRDGYHYRPRIHTPAVPGRHFYSAMRGRLEQIGQAEVQALAAQVARRLEGGA